MISLGCPTNQVDAELMLAKLSEAGYEITDNAENSDLIIVNTCGFIDKAKTEAIEAILSACELKKDGNVSAVLVTGCLAERYKQQIIDEIPEVDGVIGIGANADIVKVCDSLLSKTAVCSFPDKTFLPLDGGRLLSTPRYYAYLKIADGCSNCCTYCAIPAIRGKFRSRTVESILDEAVSLAEKGVKELVLIAQDVTKYGIDLYGKLMLSDLLKELCKIDGIEWIRLLYCYPDALTDELLDTIAAEDKICKYIDLPLQHADERILKKMNRTGSEAELMALIRKIRDKIPGVVIRTTLIAGFPGETEENFEVLSRFVEEAKFDRLGCFAYSAEEGTAAAKMPDQLDEETKNHRCELIMQQQYEIFDRIQHEKIGKIFRVLVDGYNENEMLYYGRTYMDCAEIDSSVILSTDQELLPGQFVNAKVIGVDDCDLVAEVLFDE